MQIAQIAPLTEAIPPKLYGGTERVISWLTDELVALGHEVVLFASGDSQTSAHLESCWPKALGHESGLAATLLPLRDKTATYPAEYGKRAGELIARGARSLQPTLRQKKRTQPIS
jgi:hypothetical protein